MIVAFGIYLGVPSTNHAARFAALIMAEVGHYGKSKGSISVAPRLICP